MTGLAEGQKSFMIGLVV